MNSHPGGWVIFCWMGSRLAPRVEIRVLQMHYTTTVSLQSDIFRGDLHFSNMLIIWSWLIDSESSIHYVPAITASIVIAASSRFVIDLSRLKSVDMTFLSLIYKVFCDDDDLWAQLKTIWIENFVGYRSRTYSKANSNQLSRVFLLRL